MALTSDKANLSPSLIRTLVPFIVGPLATWLANALGAPVQDLNLFLTMALASVVGYVYYVVARFLEVYVGPKWGYILGMAKSPGYSPQPPPQDAPVETPAMKAPPRKRRPRGDTGAVNIGLLLIVIGIIVALLVNTMLGVVLVIIGAVLLFVPINS